MIESFRSQEERRHTTTRMVLDMTLALQFLHAKGIIHQNVKPSKILLRDDNFVLSGFGIAMVTTGSHSVGGTDSYMPPERRSSPEGDIYRLGATAIECLEGFPKEEDRPTGQEWHNYLQTLATGRPIASMLASDPKQRPTARGLLDTYFPYSLPSREWLTTLFQDTPAPPDGVSLTRLRDIDSTRHNKLGIARTKPANSTHQEREKSQKSSKLSRRRRKCSRRKQGMKGEGKDPRPRS
jgi:serine/threonine protein kinase